MFILTVIFLSAQSSVFSQSESANSAQVSAQPDPAGKMFGVPVPLNNYYFAKRVAYMLPKPWERNLSQEELESKIWENLVIHYEATQRNVLVSRGEIEEAINKVLKDEKQEFLHSDTEKFTEWVKNSLNEDVELFENQVTYILMIDKLKNDIEQNMEVSVKEDEMIQEFLDQRHHVGGEYVLFDTKKEADQFYKEYRNQKKWEKAKKKDEAFCKKFSMITLQAIMDLWGVSREQIYEFHSKEEGTVGEPMPFGSKFGVFRLLEKRIGVVEDFSEKREDFRQRIEKKKKREALNGWIEHLKEQANLEVFVNP